MTDDEQLDRVIERMGVLLADAMAGLDPADVAERLVWCESTGQHGTRMYFTKDDDLLEFRWGGRRLAMIHRAVLLEDGPFRSEFVVEDCPDTVPDEWRGE